MTASLSYFYVRFEHTSSFDSNILSWRNVQVLIADPYHPLIMHSCLFFDASLALLSPIVEILLLNASETWSLSWPNYTYYQSIFVTLTRCLGCYIKPYRVPKVYKTNVLLAAWQELESYVSSAHTYFCIFSPTICVLYV